MVANRKDAATLRMIFAYPVMPGRYRSDVDFAEIPLDHPVVQVRREPRLPFPSEWLININPSTNTPDRLAPGKGARRSGRIASAYLSRAVVPPPASAAWAAASRAIGTRNGEHET